jgi:hypothetical protein
MGMFTLRMISMLLHYGHVYSASDLYVVTIRACVLYGLVFLAQAFQHAGLCLIKDYSVVISDTMRLLHCVDGRS